MTTLPRSIGAITLFVTDVSRAKAWYEIVFRLPVMYEDDQSAAFRFDNVIINLLHIGEASNLVTPAPVADAGAGSGFQLTIWVDDVDAALADLTASGVTVLNGPIDRVWGQRTAAFADPDGHVWEIAQTIG